MRAFMFISLLTMALVSGHALAQPAPGFTPAQRAEIVAVIRQALKTDPSLLRDAVAALQADEGVGKQVAFRTAIGQAGPALAHKAGDPSAGNPNGDVTVVEFYDLRCPYCRRMLPVVAQLLQEDPHLRLIYKDIPILGPASLLGARAVLAAQRQGGYLRLHDAIMGGGPALTEETLRDAARSAGLDWDRLHRDMDAADIQTRIDANLALASSLGIDGTPAYVIGARLIPGATDLAALRAAVADARRSGG